MSERGSSMRDLPSALIDGEALNQRLAGRRPVVFLDYDGTLTPIVDRPQDAVISDSTREAVRALARRCTVCVVSGRDRPVVQELMGVDDLGDDMIDEHAFEALKGTGIGVFVGNPDDPELAGRPTAADFVLTSIQEVERFLRTLAR